MTVVYLTSNLTQWRSTLMASLQVRIPVEVTQDNLPEDIQDNPLEIIRDNPLALSRRHSSLEGTRQAVIRDSSHLWDIKATVVRDTRWLERRLLGWATPMYSVFMQTVHGWTYCLNIPFQLPLMQEVLLLEWTRPFILGFLLWTRNVEVPFL